MKNTLKETHAAGGNTFCRGPPIFCILIGWYPWRKQSNQRSLRPGREKCVFIAWSLASGLHICHPHIMPGHWGSLRVVRGIQFNSIAYLPMLPGWEPPAIIFLGGETLRHSATMLFLTTFHSLLVLFILFQGFIFSGEKGKLDQCSLFRLKFKLTGFLLTQNSSAILQSFMFVFWRSSDTEVTKSSQWFVD
jgi:hypothetical protein